MKGGKHECSGQSPPGATSSMQCPGSLAVSELYQDKMERGETLFGKAGLALLDKHPHLSLLSYGMSVLAAMGCHPASGWAVKQQLLPMEGSQGWLKDMTKWSLSCGCDHLGLPKVTRYCNMPAASDTSPGTHLCGGR